MNYFSRLHPAVSAFYLMSVLAVTMFASNPAIVLISLICSIIFFLQIERPSFSLKKSGFCLLLFIIVSITNPLFSHNGVTVLFFMNGNPITLEAVLYGVFLAVMMLAVIFWFRCLNIILTEDKLLYLIGGISPKIALLISSALRFVPLLKNQGLKIKNAQKAMGLYASDAWTEKLKSTARTYSALVTWSLENAVDTGMSMKARGYGNKPRSRYSLYLFRKSDGLIAGLILILDIVIVTALSFGWLAFDFYPTLSYAKIGFGAIAIISFAVLCALPIILEVKEGLKWKYYISKI